MSLSNVYTAGLNNVGSYQVSGMPFATGSLTAPAVGGDPIVVQFPYVTRWVKVLPITGSSGAVTHLRVGFSENGVKNGNYFRISAKQNTNLEPVPPPGLELKVTELYFCSDSAATIEFDVVAGLTNIPVQRVNNIGPSGNNWSGSVGVG
jgi:hypothetical protein